ncbi:MAG TPA: response regulator [Rhodocyclaceae bacterium]|jgi:DNA-binding NarL/FixJ family response regulator|nr:response regulator [Rhodocyclaceae bacterium]
MEREREAAIRVVLIEDSPALRQLLSGMIADISGIEIIGAVDAEDQALAALEQYHPDVAIIDLELNQGSGLNVLRQIYAQPDRYHGLHAVVFSNHAHASVRERCRMLGASAFFDKTFQMDDLLDYLQGVAVKGAVPASPH